MKIYKNLKKLINKNIFDNFTLRNIVNMYWKIFEKNKQLRLYKRIEREDIKFLKYLKARE